MVCLHWRGLRHLRTLCLVNVNDMPGGKGRTTPMPYSDLGVDLGMGSLNYLGFKFFLFLFLFGLLFSSFSFLPLDFLSVACDQGIELHAMTSLYRYVQSRHYSFEGAFD